MIGTNKMTLNKESVLQILQDWSDAKLPGKPRVTGLVASYDRFEITLESEKVVAVTPPVFARPPTAKREYEQDRSR